MPTPLDAPEVFEQEFLHLRAKILQVAAILDRIDRAKGLVQEDPRVADVRRALEVLTNGDYGDNNHGANFDSDRAEQIQLIFSLTFDHEWRETLCVPEAGSTRS